MTNTRLSRIGKSIYRQFRLRPPKGYEIADVERTSSGAVFTFRKR
jgi:hypothetical protein